MQEKKLQDVELEEESYSNRIKATVGNFCLEQ